MPIAWAQPTGEFRKVVCSMKALRRFSPMSPVDKVIPFRNQVSQRTSKVAEWNTTVHASGRLCPGHILRKGLVYFIPIVRSLFDWPSGRQLSCIFEKSCYLAHCLPNNLHHRVASITASSTDLPSASANFVICIIFA